MPSPETAPLFAAARAAGIALVIGYAERVEEAGRLRRFYTQSLFAADGRELLRYRKIHLPVHREHDPWRAFQHLEKRYFEVGDRSWPVPEEG